MIVQFDALVEALEEMGWAAQQDSKVLWKFFKQERPVFKEMSVHLDGTVRLVSTIRGKPVAYRLGKTDWDVLRTVEEYVKDVLE